MIQERQIAFPLLICRFAIIAILLTQIHQRCTMHNYGSTYAISSKQICAGFVLSKFHKCCERLRYNDVICLSDRQHARRGSRGSSEPCGQNQPVADMEVGRMKMGAKKATRKLPKPRRRRESAWQRFFLSCPVLFSCIFHVFRLFHVHRFLFSIFSFSIQPCMNLIPDAFCFQSLHS